MYKILLFRCKNTYLTKIFRFIYETNNLEVINNLFMNNTYEVYLVSDSTGETLDRIFLALKAQFKNTEYKINQYSFTRT